VVKRRSLSLSLADSLVLMVQQWLGCGHNPKLHRLTACSSKRSAQEAGDGLK